MDNWNDFTIDPRTIPDHIILSERGRRNARRRRGSNGGLRPIPAECPKCGESCPSKRAAYSHCKVAKDS